MYKFFRAIRRKQSVIVFPVLVVIACNILYGLFKLVLWGVNEIAMIMIDTWLEKQILTPVTNNTILLIGWLNVDKFRWTALVVILWMMILITFIAYQTWLSRSIEIRKRVSVMTRETVLGIYNNSDDDLNDCFAQLVEVKPSLVPQHGQYNNLPGMMYWQGNQERINIEAGREGELILGMGAPIPLHSESIHYKLIQGKEVECEIHFKGTDNNRKVVQKWFGVKLLYDGEKLLVTKIMN
jgi:hypothetical protein